MLRRASLLVILAACTGKEDPPVPVDTDPVDLDGDGYAEDDCDDDNAAINPGAVESCDGIDNNCNNEVDESGGALWYLDQDGDGFGEDTTTVSACEQPPRYVAQAGDCVDTDNTVFPGADELCDDLDHDCDGDPTLGAVDAGTWYDDADGDGFGDLSTATEGCPIDGTVDNGDDCDDAMAEVNPDATEICNNIDDNCNGDIDTDAVDIPTWYLDDDGDGFGSPTSLDVCFAPVGYVDQQGDCNDSSADISPVGIEVCNGGIDDDCDPTTLEDDGDDALTWYADADGDDYGDSTVSMRACVQPGGFAELDGDCDDDAGGIYPGAPEICDGFDNDCDPSTDEDDGDDATAWFFDGDDDGYGTGASIQACTAPTDHVPLDGDCVDDDAGINPDALDVCDGFDNDCDGTPDPDCFLDHCGIISVSETWETGTIHRVSCDVVVRGASRPVLTIEDGAIVEFADGTAMLVGSGGTGSLDVQGDTLGVVFDAATTAPIAGSWAGLTFGEDDDDSTIVGLQLSHGGGNGDGGIVIDGSTLVTIRDSDIVDNLGAGIDVQGGTLALSGTSVQSNIDDGIHLDAAGSLDGFSSNTISLNGSHPVVLPATEVHELDGISTFTGNGEEEVLVFGSTIDRSVSWSTLDVPYLISADLQVAGAVNPVLTLQDGMVLRFADTVGLSIGVNNSGTLDTAGGSEGVRFEGKSSGPGSWDGVRVGSRDRGSILNFLEVSDAGGNGRGGLWLSSPETVTILGANIHDNANNGIKIDAGTVDLSSSLIENNSDFGIEMLAEARLASGTAMQGSFHDNIITGNGDNPLSIPAIVALELDPTSTYQGNGEDTVLLAADTIDRTGVLRALDVPFEVMGDVFVQGNIDPEVTVRPGARFWFRDTANLYTGWNDDGTLTVEAGDDPTRFTTVESTATAGDWPGLSFGARDGGSVLDNVIVEYAGGNGRGGIRVTGADITVLNSEIANNANNGIEVSGGTITVEGTVLANNTEYGVDMDANGVLGGPFIDNQIAASGIRPMRLSASEVGQLDASSVYNVNDDSRIEVTADTVRRTASWQALGVPLFLTGDVFVQGAEDPELTLEDGLVIESAATAAFRVGWNDDGTLVSAGTTAGVRFTSPEATPQPGDWPGMSIGSRGSGTALTLTTIEYAGGNGRGGLDVRSATVSLDRVTLRHNAGNGLHMQGAVVDATDCVFDSNTESGVTADNTSMLGTFTGNTYTNNGEHPLDIPANYAGMLDGADTYAGNTDDTVALKADTVTDSQTWAALEVPYLVLGDVFAQGAASPELIIEGGATLLMGANATLYAGWNDSGSLTVQGTDEAEVVITGLVETAGYWSGIRLGSRDEGSSLSYTTVEYGGGNGRGNISVGSGEPATFEHVLSQSSSASGLEVDGGTVWVQHSSFIDNGEYGVELSTTAALDSTAAHNFAHNDMSGNTDGPIILPPEYVGQLADSSSYDDNDEPIQVRAGTISSTAQWLDLDEDLAVQGDVFVQGGADPVLTIADGVAMMWASNATFYVGWNDDGGIAVEGASLGVTLTSDAASPNRGDWRGLRMGSRTTRADLEALTVSYAGSSGRGGISVQSTDVTLSSCTVIESSTSGLHVDGGMATVTGSRFESNGDHGVELTNTAALAGSFASNTMTGNGEGPISLPADSVGALSSTSTYTGNGDPIQVLADTVTRSATWQALDEDMQVLGDVFVQGPANPMVTISSGAVLTFDANVTFYVGFNDTGSLHVDGSTAPVVFTSSQAVPTRGHWSGIRSGSRADTLIFDGLDVSYGGGNGRANLNIDSSTATLSFVTSTESSNAGVSALTGSTVLITDSDLSDNGTYGLFIDATSSLDTLGGPTFVRNTLTGNGREPISLPINNVGQLDVSCDFSGNTVDRVQVNEGTVSDTALWQRLNVPYLITDTSFIQGPANPVVTIEAGTIVNMGAGAELYVGFNSPGGMLAEGTSTDPIEFTIGSLTGAAGDWRGIRFGSRCLPAMSVLDYAIVQWAGGNGNGAVYLQSCEATVTNSTILDSSTWGIARSNAVGVLSGNTFANCANGDIQ